LLCDHPHSCGILVLADLTVEKNDDAEARRFGCVAMCGIEKIGNAAESRADNVLKIRVGGYAVCIEQTYRAEGHVSVLADSFLQPASDKTANVLELAALCL